MPEPKSANGRIKTQKQKKIILRTRQDFRLLFISNKYAPTIN